MSVRNDVTIISPNDKEELCAEFVIDDTSAPFLLNGVTQIGERYVLSFWMRSNSNALLKVGETETLISTKWERYKFSFTADEEDVKIYFNNKQNYYLYRAQLETGNVLTDWSPSPEDIKASLEVKIDSENLISEINASADVINLSGDRIIVNSTHFKVREDGSVDASNINISGTSKFLSEDKVFESNVEIKDGKITTKSKLTESVTDAFGTEYYNTNTGSEGAKVSIGSFGLSLYDEEDEEPEFPEDIQAVIFKRIDPYNPVGVINSFGMYGWDQNGIISKLISWDGIADLYKITANGVPVTGNRLYNADGIGNVVMGKDGDYYYLRPYEGDKVLCGSSNNPWYRVYTNRLTVMSSKPTFTYIGSNGNGSTVTSPPNMYVASDGVVSRTTNSASSKTIKHDIQPLGKLESLDAKKLYDVDVVQFKYNEEVGIDAQDIRYKKDLPGFIIEDLDKKYPIAVDKPSDDVKEWSWNEHYLIPAMLKLIQEQNERIKELEKAIGIINKY